MRDRRRRFRGEYGSGSVLMVGVMTVVMLLAFTAVLVAGYLVAVHRVRAGADLAALSGAAAVATGADACSAARRNLQANGGRLVKCEQIGDQLDFVVTVTASVRLRVRVPGLPTSVRATAHAGSDS